MFEAKNLEEYFKESNEPEEKEPEVLNEDYKSDTKKYIESVLEGVDDKGAKKFLEGLKKFVDDNGFLTPAQRKGLAQFRKNK